MRQKDHDLESCFLLGGFLAVQFCNSYLACSLASMTPSRVTRQSLAVSLPRILTDIARPFGWANAARKSREAGRWPDFLVGPPDHSDPEHRGGDRPKLLYPASPPADPRDYMPTRGSLLQFNLCLARLARLASLAGGNNNAEFSGCACVRMCAVLLLLLSGAIDSHGPVECLQSRHYWCWPRRSGGGQVSIQFQPQ
jgi:hypothetical protein